MQKKKHIIDFCCKNCGSSDVEQKEWRKINTGEFSGLDEVGDTTWCCDCETHCGIEYRRSGEKSMTQELAMLIEELLKVYWTDEERHWEEEGRPDKHLFSTFKKLQAKLDDYYIDKTGGLK